MARNDKIMIRFSRGTGKNFGKAKNLTKGYAEFRKLFQQPTRTKERFKVYLSKSVEEQVDLKSVDGWIYRTQIEGKRRNRSSGKPSDLITLDMDYATSEFMDRLEMGLVLPNIDYFVHSTRRHEDEKPRLRIYIPVERPITNDEYPAVSRIVAEMFDPEMKMVDPVSFRPAQMMFLPTCSIDGDWFYTYNEGELLNPDDVFEAFEDRVGDWRILTNLPHCEGEKLRETADKAEDPTTKRGPVGDFCRAFDVIEAIDKFELPYEPVDDHSAKPRYTYTGGTTSSGAVVEDDGLFLYSHHGSDPCADMLVNAFDLVRIHKFGKLDDDEPEDTPPSQWPSYKAMIDFLADVPEYKRSQAQSKYDMSEMFDDVMDDYFQEGEDEEPEPEEEAPAEEGGEWDSDIDELVGKPRPKSDSGAASAASRPRDFGRKKKPPKDWFPDELELDKAGNIVQNLPNAQVIAYNDPRLFGAIAFDEFMRRVVLRRDIMSNMATVPPCYCRDKLRGDIWQDVNDLTVRAILAAPNGKGKRGYGIDKLAERDVAGAIMMTAQRNRFHPIKDYLWQCELDGWDGTKRVEKMFIDYLGMEDSPYARQTAKMIIVASVARIFEPGHKFDFSPVLEGEGGIRKSSFIEYLYGKENFGELTCDLKDTQKIAETIGGVWSLEFPEMTSFHKSDYNDAKQFLSAKQDMVRMAYDRRVSVFPRQATFWGTTNNTKYLKDPTGNRRWWPIHVNVTMIDTDRLLRERDQIWAEGVMLYKAMRAEQPHGDLALFLTDPDAIREATALQTGARQRQMYEQWVDEIREWLDTPVPLQRLLDEYNYDRFPDPERGIDPEKIMVERVVVLDSDILLHVIREEGVVKNQQTIQNFDSAMGVINEWKPAKYVVGKDRFSCFGKQARWKVRVGATEEEIAQGYRVIDDDGEDLI